METAVEFGKLSGEDIRHITETIRDLFDEMLALTGGDNSRGGYLTVLEYGGPHKEKIFSVWIGGRGKASAVPWESSCAEAYCLAYDPERDVTPTNLDQLDFLECAASGIKIKERNIVFSFSGLRQQGNQAVLLVALVVGNIIEKKWADEVTAARRIGAGTETSPKNGWYGLLAQKWLAGL